MLKILIVEDEIYIREVLKSILSDMDLPLEIIGECDNAHDAVVVTKACKPDVILLDINLKGDNGFHLLEETTHLDYEVIFVTAYEEFALKAIKNGALDYILKPIDEEELKTAIEKAQQRIEQKINIKDTQPINDKKRIVLRLQEQVYLLQLNDLIYCSSEKGYTTFHLSDGQKIIVSKPLNYFENLLPSSSFFRTHQSYMVNILYIKNYDKVHAISLQNNEKVPVAVRKKEAFMEWLES